ncbi:MAG: Lar family restriction alleviation protein [Nitrososphaerota archaeon]|nr:Lar family restriction alleviation protein [Nitrososphaerota archaeon]
MSEAIGKCPFCGGEEAAMEAIDLEDDEPGYYVGCPGCGGNGPLEADMAEAARWWNGVSFVVSQMFAGPAEMSD